MRLARFIMPLLLLPLILLNPGIFSMLRQTPVVRDVAAPSVEHPSLVDVENVETTTPPTSIAPSLQANNPTALPTIAPSPTRLAQTDPLLDRFVASVKNGKVGEMVGVYVPIVLAHHVVQQPVNDPAYVSTAGNDVTQFRLATAYGAIGLLAHNYLSGALFFRLLVGQEVDIIYGNGVVRRYTIFALRHFQALRPTDPKTNFLDIDSNQTTQISNADLFHQIYSDGRVVFQTCITRDGNTSWGRLFVIARPLQ